MTEIIYLGLFGVYPSEHNDEHHSERASEGTKKISDLMDEFITNLQGLQKEYSNEGAMDTSAREHIFEKLWNRYNNKRLG